MRRAPQYALVASVFCRSLAAQLPDIGPPPGQLIDVGGRTMHILCSGNGSPTILLEAGASSFAIDFTLVQREVAKTSRVCSYDRAGHGWSAAATNENRRSVQADLHALLEGAGEKPPYVLAGASMGGLHVRAYHADYPPEVVGMVLVDASSEDRAFTFYNGEAVTIASLTSDQLRTTIPERTVPIRRRQPQRGAPFDRLPPDLYATRIKLDERLIASGPDSVSYEVVFASADAERARLARLLDARKRDPQPLGERPLVVLTRDTNWSLGLQETHAALARLSSNSRHTRVTRSGHEVHLFVPEAVVQAIQDVAEASRTKSRLPPRSW